MIEVCDFDPTHKEFAIQHNPTQQKDISSHNITSKMNGHKMMSQNYMYYDICIIIGFRRMYNHKP
jgi:hypothetical protein